MIDLEALTQKVKNDLRHGSIYPVRAVSNMINSALNEAERAKDKHYTDLTKKAELIAQSLFFEYAQKEQIDFSGDYDRVKTEVLPIPNTSNIKVTVSFEYVGHRGFGFIYFPVLFDLHRHEAELSLMRAEQLPEPTVVEVGNFYCPQTLCSSKNVFDVLFFCGQKFGKMQYEKDISQSLRRWFINESTVSFEVLQEIHGDRLTDRALKAGLQSLVDEGLLEYDDEDDTYCLTNHKPAGDLGY